jgi:ribosomal protein L22
MSPDEDKTEAEAEKPKRRRSRAKAKPADAAATEAAATEDAVADKTPAEDAPAKKPRRSRAKKPAAAEASSGDAPAEEAPAAEEEAAPAAKAKPARSRARKPKAKAAEADEPAKPAPARRRGGVETVAAPPVVRAHAKYVRSSARKARLVCDHIRGKDVDEARAILRFAPRAVARDWEKLLESAVANAEHNHELVGDDLRVKEAFADEGPTLKRFRPRAMGRATQIRKRTSHLTITLTPKETA